MALIILAILMFLPAGAFSQSAPPQAAPPDPMSLPTRDSHQNLTIVADPYIREARYSKETFGKKSIYSAGIAAIDVYFRNDNNIPIRLNLATIQLVVSMPDQERQRLGPLSPEDVADRTLLTANANVHAHRPFPFPGSPVGPNRNKDWVDMTTSLRSVALSSDVLPPQATTHGFLFFDVNHDFTAIRSSHLYIPDLAFMTDKKALFFFEIDLADTPSR